MTFYFRGQYIPIMTEKLNDNIIMFDFGIWIHQDKKRERYYISIEYVKNTEKWTPFIVWEHDELYLSDLPYKEQCEYITIEELNALYNEIQKELMENKI